MFAFGKYETRRVLSAVKSEGTGTFIMFKNTTSIEPH